MGWITTSKPWHGVDAHVRHGPLFHTAFVNVGHRHGADKAGGEENKQVTTLNDER